MPRTRSSKHTFTYTVELEPDGKFNTTIENSVNTNRTDHLYALIRAMAKSPSTFVNLKDENIVVFKDEKTGANYKIKFHQIYL